eukprot:569781-Pyramimonas_sp.AAC.1
MVHRVPDAPGRVPEVVVRWECNDCCFDERAQGFERKPLLIAVRPQLLPRPDVQEVVRHGNDLEPDEVACLLPEGVGHLSLQNRKLE